LDVADKGCVPVGQHPIREGVADRHLRAASV
jgi:hypothetical protein